MRASGPELLAPRNAHHDASWKALGAGGLVAAGAVAHLAPAATAWRQARNRVLPALSGVGKPDHVALTFDDGPDPASTPAFLETLDALGWRATFFLLGEAVQRSPGLAAEIAARGHEIGVHGYSHTSHIRRPWTWTSRDVARARDVIQATTGTEPEWFRPPYGALSGSSLVAARRAALRTVLWTTWGRDWRSDATAASVAATVTATWRPGATVLLHDSDVTSAPGAWRAALGALPLLRERWAVAGLEVGPLGRHGTREREKITTAPA
ncbi:MAG TPA: polysaccharide deacetylase family protein [Acidimicrobiales bacterium]|nr:polysaccharide deacetylase family protein [Acidimicrobiales bacterium]